MSIEKDLTEIDFFISSTFIDLEKYRESIINKIRSKQGTINAQEFFGSRPNSPLETMIEELKKSDVVILIIAHRYGSIDSDSGKSYTQIEYETARYENKLILPYIIDDSYPFNPMFVDKGIDVKKLELFKDEIRKNYTVSTFTDEEDLSNKVIRDLARELPKNNFNIGKPEEEKVDKLFIRQLCELPKLMDGKEIELEVILKEKWISAENGICNALSLEEGATIKREYELKDSEVNKIIEKKFKYIYAQNDNAIKLSELEEGEYRLLVRLKYGYLERVATKDKIVKEKSNYSKLLSISKAALYGYEPDEEKVIKVETKVYSPCFELILVAVNA